MRRILLLLASAAILAPPVSAAARPHGHAIPGYLVVRNGSADAGVNGSPVVTVVVQGGFVIGRIAGQGKVALYHASTAVPQAAGVGVSSRKVFYHHIPGLEFSGSGFRFRGVGGVWRVVVYGSGVSLYAGGVKQASLHGSVSYPNGDGEYSLNGRRFVSLPSAVVGGAK